MAAVFLSTWVRKATGCTFQEAFTVIDFLVFAGYNRNTSIKVDTQKEESVSNPKYIWREFLNHNRCGLCGNRGLVDTRSSALSPAGVHCGVMRPCICPNGRAIKDDWVRLNMDATEESKTKTRKD